MNIQPKQISLAEPRTFNLTKLEVSHTLDIPKQKTLKVYLVGVQVPVVITGAEFDGLGQWTDETLLTFLVQKLQLTVIENS